MKRIVTLLKNGFMKKIGYSEVGPGIILVDGGRGTINYDKTSKKFYAKEPGFVSVKLSACGVYGLASEHFKDFDDFVNKAVKSFGLSREEILSVPPSFADAYWVFLGNAGYNDVMDILDSETVDEEGNPAYYEFADYAQVDRIINDIIKELAREYGNTQEGLGRAVDEVQGDFEFLENTFVRRILEKADWEYVPID